MTQSDLGMYLVDSSTLAFSTGGVNRLSVSNSEVSTSVPIRAPIGTTTLPGLAFNNATNVGFSVGGSALNFVYGGTTRASVSTSGMTVGSTLGSIFSIIRHGASVMSAVMAPGTGTNIFNVSIGVTMPNTFYRVLLTTVPTNGSVSAHAWGFTTTTFNVGFQNVGSANSDAYVFWFIIV
jgi:hypothetical protein